MWAQEPDNRPSAQVVVAQLEAILRQLGVQPSTPVIKFSSALVSERPEKGRGGGGFGVP